MDNPTLSNLHPAEQYIDDVLNDRIVVSSYVRQAVERHVRDLSGIELNGFYFDRAEAEFVCNCFKLFRHCEGDFAGREFILSPWQSFIVWVVFGWKKMDDDMRRFRRVYVEVARKNGKSTFLSAIAIFLLLLDGEPAAQVYCAATKLDQAKIVWNDARRMVKASPELKQAIRVYRSSLAVPSTDSIFVPLASDSKSLDGLNISGAVVDELHAHPTREVWDLIDGATGSRSQPLICVITTAGFIDGICVELRDLCIDILKDAVKNEEWFAYIACIDKDDQYLDEQCWIKANPNIPYVPSLLPFLRQQASMASRSAGARNTFLVKHLCRWTSQGTPWLNVSDWNKCKAAVPFTYEDMKGRPAFGGIDLAEKLDLTCTCLLFPPIEIGEKWRYLWSFYLPEMTLAKHRENQKHRWQEWVDAGLLSATEGFTTDQKLVEKQVLKWRDDFDLQQCAYDPHSMHRLASDLTDAGITMVEITQNFDSLNEASKEFEAQIVSGTMEHNGGSLMRAQVEAVCIQQSHDGFIRPIKPKRHKADAKIDGILGAVMALGQAIRNPIGQSAGFMFFA